MMDNIPNLRFEVLIDYVLTKRNACIWNQHSKACT